MNMVADLSSPEQYATSPSWPHLDMITHLCFTECHQESSKQTNDIMSHRVTSSN